MMDVWKRKLKVHMWPFWGMYSLNFKLCIHNFPFHSEIEDFFFSGCPISQLHVFGDDLSGNWR